MCMVCAWLSPIFRIVSKSPMYSRLIASPERQAREVAARGLGIGAQEHLVKAAVSLVMIVTEIAFLRRSRIEPEHHKHNTRFEAHRGGSSWRRERATQGSVPHRVSNRPCCVSGH